MRKHEWPEEFSKKLRIVIPGHRLLVDELMSRHTTFKIGGPADFLAMPASIAEVAAILDLAKEYKVPVFTFGNGSNLLVLDRGIRGIALKFGKDMGFIKHKGTTIIAGAGSMLASVSKYAADNKFTGMEFAVGIPGSIGGAIFMNAGAYDGEMSCVVSAVSCVCENGNIRRFSKEESKFTYRHSAFQDNGCTICEVELLLEEGDPAAIRSKMAEYIKRRQTKQPVEMPSAGSTFKRPPGYYAGTLIDQAGLKGLTVGGAQVSTKHAGFIVNAGGATANDVLTLIKEVQLRVHDAYGVDLQPEVRILGEA
ncbi:UDP-N-acetylenolpyruvoylglucosamine reductase [bioreactor metagenome]|uniref:UDP-N-acetylmuramate dehydrogenase n=1 Tax=bioreactor metagenome TaxID=1076179 RepID=A0A644URP1_9ZZZZ|nr:UDP-N-acetylmuramate dehydrogenase [Negativicutes bacterium]